MSTIAKAITAAIDAGNVEFVEKTLRANPSIVDTLECGYSFAERAVLPRAYANGGLAMLETIVGAGCNLNQLNKKARCTPLQNAVLNGNAPAVNFLLSKGADPNLLTPLLNAILVEPEETAIEIMKMMIDHGLDPKKKYSAIGQSAPVDALFFADLHSKKKIAAFLKGYGLSEAQEAATEPSDLRQFCEEQFGKAERLVLKELIPLGPDFHVCVSYPTSKNGSTTLYSEGLSSTRFNSVTVVGKQLEFAEIFIQLPGRWPLDKDSWRKAESGWPLHWIFNIVRQLKNGDAALESQAIVWSASENDDETIAPGLAFTAFLLLAEFSKEITENKGVFLFRMMPLYKEEVELERNEGIGSLLRAFDQSNIPLIVDVNRKNVAK